MSDNNNNNNNNSNRDTEPQLIDSIAGILRNILRNNRIFNNIINSLNRANLGSLPRIKTKPQIQSIVKSAEKLSNLLDIHDSYQSIKSLTSDSDKKSTNNKSNKLINLFNNNKIIILKTSFKFLYNSILGSILFSSYEYNSYYINKHYNNNKNRTNISNIFSLSTTCGAISGGIHGISIYSMSSLTDKLQNLLHRYNLNVLSKSLSITSMNNPIGLTISHSIIHGALFGVYETMKPISCHCINSLLSADRDASSNPLLNEFETKITIDIISILFSGLLAGYISELSAHYTSPLEIIQKNIRRASDVRLCIDEYLVRLKDLRKPNHRAIALASLPSALGFLIYELTKSQFTN